VQQVTRYRAHQQQALADAKATIHQLKGQLCKARCLSKQRLAAALEQADTAAAYLQQVSRLQQALVREGAARALAEAEAARQGALVVSLEQEVADLASQLAALQQQLQQQASSAGKALREAGYDRDMAEHQVKQLAAKLQQQEASSEAALTLAQGKRDAAQLQAQGLSTQLQQVQGQLAGCQQELVEARAALPTPEQLQQYGQWFHYYQAYPALHAAYQEQGTQLQQAVGERDAFSQALSQTQQQLQQVLAERDSLAQQLGAVVAMCNTKQQQVTDVQGQLAEVQQQLEATQQRNQRLMRLVADHDEQLGHAERELQEAQQQLAGERKSHQDTKTHLHSERAKACMVVTALNQVLAMVGPGRVVGVGKFEDVAGSGAQGLVQRVSLCVQLGGGKTPQEAEQEGLTPPKRPGKPWKEKAVMKLGEPRGAAQEVALAALATVKSAESDGLLLGPRLRYVQLGRFGEKPRLFFERWGGNLWQLLTQVRGGGHMANATCKSHSMAAGSMLE
jgi:chromosome segregation ATPase